MPRKRSPQTPDELSSLGPKSREMLARAGIVTSQQLRALGAVQAYWRTRQVSPHASQNLLWGLQSALTGIPWREVARLQREALLTELERLQATNEPPT